MKNLINTPVGINISSLYDGKEEFADLIRATACFLTYENTTSIDYERFVQIDRTLYDNELAMAIATLTLDYSNQRANNLIKYYFLDCENTFGDDVIKVILHTIIDPEDTPDKYFNLVKQIFNALEEDMYISQFYYLCFSTFEEDFAEVELILNTGKDKYGNISLKMKKELQHENSSS